MLSKRIKAYLLDILFIFMLVSLVTSIKFLNPDYDKYIESFNNYQQIQEKYLSGDLQIDEYKKNTNIYYYELSRYRVSYNIVTIVILFSYFVLFQKYNNGQTLGKKIMKIKVSNDLLTNQDPSLKQYIIRLLSTYYIYVGSVIPLFINSIFVYIFKEQFYITITSIVNYICLAISIISVVLIKQKQIGIEDKLSKTSITKSEEK